MNSALAMIPSERNKRSVWTVATHSFKGAHFATFPPDLIQPVFWLGLRGAVLCWTLSAVVVMQEGRSQSSANQTRTMPPWLNAELQRPGSTGRHRRTFFTTLCQPPDTPSPIALSTVFKLKDQAQVSNRCLASPMLYRGLTPH